MDAQMTELDVRHLRSLEPNDQRTIHQLVTLCADLQSDLAALRAQVSDLTARLNDADAHSALMQLGMEFMGSELSTVQAMRDALNAVFTIEAPAACSCEACNGSGKWTDNIGQDHFCWACNGTGEVQS